MLDTLLTAAILGALAGAVPGPYTTALAGTAVGKGFRPAFRLAFVPLVTDVPPMLVTALVLDRLSGTLLTGVGVLGGLLLAGLGVRFLRRDGEEGDGSGSDGAHTATDFRQLAAAGLLSPAPWFFWLVAASPLLLRAWRRSPVQGVVFAVVLFVVLLSTGIGVAWAAARGRTLIRPKWRRRVLRGAGVALVVAGGFVVWRSLEGDFQSMIERQEQIREAVD